MKLEAFCCFHSLGGLPGFLEVLLSINREGIRSFKMLRKGGLELLVPIQPDGALVERFQFLKGVSQLSCHVNGVFVSKLMRHRPHLQQRFNLLLCFPLFVLKQARPVLKRG